MAGGVCEIPLQSWMEPGTATAVDVCRTGPHAFFWSMSCFHRILFAKSQTLHESPNVQTCSVWQSTLSTSHPMVVFQAKEYGQLVSQDFQSPDICICTAKQGGGKPRSVCGSQSNGENFLCIRRKFLLALTAIYAFTAWVPCQLFFLC